MNLTETDKQKQIAYIIGAAAFGMIGFLTILGFIPVIMCIALVIILTAYLYLVARDNPDEDDELE